MDRQSLDSDSKGMETEAQGVLGEPRLIEETGVAARVAHVAQPVLTGLGYQTCRAGARRPFAGPGAELQALQSTAPAALV